VKAVEASSESEKKVPERSKEQEGEVNGNHFSARHPALSKNGTRRENSWKTLLGGVELSWKKGVVRN